MINAYNTLTSSKSCISCGAPIPLNDGDCCYCGRHYTAEKDKVFFNFKIDHEISPAIQEMMSEILDSVRILGTGPSIEDLIA